MNTKIQANKISGIALKEILRNYASTMEFPENIKKQFFSLILVNIEDKDLYKPSRYDNNLGVGFENESGKQIFFVITKGKCVCRIGKEIQDSVEQDDIILETGMPLIDGLEQIKEEYDLKVPITFTIKHTNKHTRKETDKSISETHIEDLYGYDKSGRQTIIKTVYESSTSEKRTTTIIRMDTDEAISITDYKNTRLIQPGGENRIVDRYQLAEGTPDIELKVSKISF